MVTVEHLTKYYGDFLAVEDLSFEIGDGKVYGLLGPNGAGKSTTMNIMTGCLSATEGKVLIDGHDIFEEPEEAKRQIGYLPEQPPLYVNETPLEYLRFVGEAKGLKGEELKKQIAEVVELTGLSGVQRRLISALSKGYKQRVGIAQALLGNPKVIILDEPTVGLDPIQIIEIRDLIKSLGEDHTVILSSHILSEVQLICEKVLIISRGKLVAFDAPENLENVMSTNDVISLTVEGTEEDVKRVLGDVEQISGFEITGSADGQTQVQVEADPDQLQEVRREISFAFATEKILVVEMTTKKVNLEDIFLELTEAGAAEDDAVAAAKAAKEAEEAPEPAEKAEAEEPETEEPETEESKAEEPETEAPGAEEPAAVETEEEAAQDEDPSAEADKTESEVTES